MFDCPRLCANAENPLGPNLRAKKESKIRHWTFEIKDAQKLQKMTNRFFGV